MITTVLFDLDGTLLPMEQECFVHAYLKGLCQKAAPHGYEPKKLADSIWAGTAAMVQNDGLKNNEAAFWDVFASIHGEKSRQDVALFDDFYHHEFQQVRHSCGYQPMAKPLIDSLKTKGLRLILATNPIFPRIATQSRIRWAGLQPEDFTYITTYENACHCKPNLDYYRDILTQCQLSPSECLMVGNDVDEDMIAQELGIKVFLLTDCVINKQNKETTKYPQGNFAELADYLQSNLHIV